MATRDRYDGSVKDWTRTDEPCVRGFVYVEREHPTIEGAIERKLSPLTEGSTDDEKSN